MTTAQRWTLAISEVVVFFVGLSFLLFQSLLLLRIFGAFGVVFSVVGMVSLVVASRGRKLK